MSDTLDSVALTDAPWPGDWSRRAKCRNAPPDLFFPGRGDPTNQAIAICNLCPVRAECLEYALDVPRLHGVWGGTSAVERERIRDARQQPRPERSRPSREVAARGTLDRTLEQLTSHPGVWARVVSYPSKHSASAVASLLRNGHKRVPAGEWTFEGRLLPDDVGSALYARYDGPAAALIEAEAAG